MITKILGRKRSSYRFNKKTINCTIYAFFKKPKEAMIVLSKMFSYVFGNPNENQIVYAKCALYYNLLKNEMYEFEKTFTQFFETGVEVSTEEDKTQTHENLNTFSLIYNKQPETFTKSYKYFITQRLLYKKERGR